MKYLASPSFAKFITYISLSLAAASICAAQPNGKVRFSKRQDPSFDPYTNNPTATLQQWMRTNFFRMMEYSPYFDSKTTWYPTAQVYFDSYAIYTNSPLVTQHPEWILKDANGNKLYIPYACANGTCPQYAADVSSPSYQSYWINHAKSLIPLGYKGVWVDDVNMNFSVSDGNGNLVAPVDPNTGAVMQWTDWRRYMAGFLQNIRASMPGVELLHNSVWYAGPSGVRDADPYIQQQIQAADILNIERGINDGGLTGGTGVWSLSALFAYIDRVHALGKAVVIDDFATTRPEREYALAGYFLITKGADLIGNQSMDPTNWWNGYNVDLGAPSGMRTIWNGLVRRDFQNGLVLLNEPQAPTITVTLPPGVWTNLDGARVTSVTLAQRQGIVLCGAAAPPTMSGVSVSSVTSTSATITWTTSTPTTGRVDFGTTASYGQNVVSAALSTSHSATVTGLTPGVLYHAQASGQDANGAVVRSADITFTTPLAAATLTVVSRSPTANTTGIAISASVTAGFSAPLLASSVTGATAYITKSGSTWALAAAVSYNATAGSIVLRPAAFLSPSSTYVMTLKGGSAGIKNANGVALPADVTWSFTTAPGSLSYLSDLKSTYETNGWGPVERDRSNGDIAAGDGRTISLNGATYAKGLGAHAKSEVRYALNGACGAFYSDIGVDDEVPAGTGSVIFQVWADGVKLYDSGKMIRGSAVQRLNVGIAGRNQLSLIITDAGDGNGNDHGDWASAMIQCNATATTTYVSGLTPIYSTNGWGPVEKDMSVGDFNAGDGKPLSINKVAYAKGLGTHAASDVRFDLNGACQTFLSDVGVDDEVPVGSGSVIFQVWADSVKLFDSGKMIGGSSTQKVNVSVAGKQQLRLRVTDAGDGVSWDHADWAGARLTCTGALGSNYYLSDLTPLTALNGWGPVELDQSNGEAAAGDGQPMKIAGIAYAKGLGVHATSDITYKLSGICSKFIADIGVDDEIPAGSGSVIFQIWVDGVNAYQTALLSSGMAAQTVSVPVTGASQLRLVVTDGGNGNGQDHADWANARLSCSSKP